MSALATYQDSITSILYPMGQRAQRISSTSAFTYRCNSVHKLWRSGFSWDIHQNPYTHFSMTI